MAFRDTIFEKVLKNGKDVRVTKFGTFKPKDVAPKSGVVPGTTKKYESKGSKTIKFVASTAFKVSN